MTHTPGWAGDLKPPDRGPETLAHFLEIFHDVPQLAHPGEVWGYNNAGWGVAGRVIEAVTDNSFDAAVHDFVFAPLVFRSEDMAYASKPGHAPVWAVYRGTRDQCTRPRFLGLAIRPGPRSGR